MNVILALALTAQLHIPAPVGYVNDFAVVIDDAARRAMLAMIEDVRAKSGGEIVVVTLRDLGGRSSIEVARDIGRQWQVGLRGGPGDRARNAGVILLLKPGRRPGDGQAELAIATGTGAEGFITDARTGRMRDAIGEAAVEGNSYAAGLVVGVRLLAEAYAREFGFELAPGPLAPGPAARRSVPTPASPRLLNVLLAAAIILFFIALASGARRPWGRYGYRPYHYRRRGGLGWFLLGTMMSGGRRGGWGGRSGGGFGGFGGFGGGGGFSGGGASGRF